MRLVVPGYLGARWVKWLDGIRMSPDESANFYQARDYKILPPEVSLCIIKSSSYESLMDYVQVESKEAAIAAWPKYPAITSLPLNSVIGSVVRRQVSDSEPTLMVKGYATQNYDQRIAAVEVTLDDGETWYPSKITYQEGRWSWTLWEAVIPGLSQHGTVRSRAIDELGQKQPRECKWNFRGVAYNPWGIGKW